jgi:hypothetical protein
MPPSPVSDALHVPKVFRRPTGAHEIIGSLLLADLGGFLLTTLAGALMGPPVWWIVRAFRFQLHASLAFAISALLILFCLVWGLLRRTAFQKHDAWGTPLFLISLILCLLLLFYLIRAPFLAIPATRIPAIPLEPFSWLRSLSLPGATIAAALSLLAHRQVMQCYQAQTAKGIPYARAHPNGIFWGMIEQAYDLYRRNLTRFDPPPVDLRTPPTFLYFDAPALPEDPECALFWDHGSLVLSRVLLHPDAEYTRILLPLLARLLCEYQSPNLQVEKLFTLAQIATSRWFTAVLLAIPLGVARSKEHQWLLLEKERVLDQDRFAYWCGESKRLRNVLQQQLDQRQRNGQPDTTVPTLTERIEHLQSLTKHEVRQVKALRAMLPSTTPSPPD